jgi:hypothetical protein
MGCSIASGKMICGQTVTALQKNSAQQYRNVLIAVDSLKYACQNVVL